MIALDSNVLLRLLTRDDMAQVGKAQRAIEAAEDAHERVLVNDLVLAETLWALKGRYDADKASLLLSLHGLLGSASFVFESRAVLVEAVRHFEASSAGFADCLIAAKNAALGASATLTFDKAMRTLPTVRLL